MIHLRQPYEVLYFNFPFLHLLYWKTVFLALVEQMVAGFYPSALLPFCQIYKWLHYFVWGILTIHDSVYEKDGLATGCLYCLNKMTSSQVYTASSPSVSLGSKLKQRAWKPHKVRNRLDTKFLKTISVLMKAMSHKSVLLISNFSIVS